MLNKDLYDSWKSRMELYMQNREHRRMILKSVEYGLLIWPTIEVNGVTRTKKYAELSPTEKIQADCDMKAINIILQGLPNDIYSLVNHHIVSKDLWEKVQLLMQGTRANTSGTGGIIQGKSSVGRTQGNGKVLNKEELEFLADLGIAEAKAALMANLSSYGSYVLFKVPISNNTNMLNQSVQEMSYSEPSYFMEHSENKIHSDSNIITYSQYLIESQNAAVQDTNSSAQQDALILSVFEQLSNQVTNCNKVNNDNLIANETLSAKLERYKEQKAQQIRPMLYDGNVIAKETNVISIVDSEETLMLKEESRSKMILKQTYKQLYDLIKPSRVRAKEQTESLVNQVNKKCVEISDLNAQLQEKVVVITTLKIDLRKLKGKEIADNAAQVTNATNVAPGLYKLNPIILAPKVKNNREAHEYYLNHNIEQAAILRELIQELLGYLRDTCHDIHKPSEKLVAVTLNKKKTIRYADTVTSSGNIPKVPNRPLLSYTGVNPSTSASGSNPSSNTKNDRIPNSDSKNVCNELVKHPVKGAKALCSVCNECLFDANHVMCIIDHVNSMNVRAKFVSKKSKTRREWKPNGNVFNSVGYKLKPIGRTFTLVGNACPLTRLTATNKVTLRVPIPLEVVAPKHVVTRVYTRRPKVPKSVQNIKPKVAKSMTANRMEPVTSRGSDTSVAPSFSSLIDCMLSKLLCGIWTPDAPST
ncbi:hypothetical protein Tco_1147939 [Tanacetum coccineum]